MGKRRMTTSTLSIRRQAVRRAGSSDLLFRPVPEKIAHEADSFRDAVESTDIQWSLIMGGP